MLLRKCIVPVNGIIHVLYGLIFTLYIFHWQRGFNLMLTSIISSSAISSSAISSSAISMLTTPGLPAYGAIVVVGLILLLSFKEVLSASSLWGKPLRNSLDIGIYPLLLSFVAIVVFKVAEIL